MKTINVLVGPRLGDLFHTLAFPRYAYDKMGIKSNIYITETNDTFQFGLDRAYQDLKPIIEIQDFCNTFEIYNPDIHKISVNTMKYRTSPYLYKTTWPQIILNTFISSQPKVPYNFKILDIPGNELYKDALIINRANGKHDITDFSRKTYLDVINQFDKKYFIFVEEKHYDEFFHKDIVEPLYVPNLYDFMSVISGCKCFIGNQSGPFAIASVLNVPRIGELFHKTLFRDDIHYLNDGNNYDCVELFNMESYLTDKKIYLK